MGKLSTQKPNLHPQTSKTAKTGTS